MKTLIKTSIVMVFLMTLISCEIQKPISKLPPDNNKTYKLEYLFEHDGCKVYRFRDHGHYVYFTNCKSDVTSIENDSTEVRVVNMINTDDSK